MTRDTHNIDASTDELAADGGRIPGDRADGGPVEASERVAIGLQRVNHGDALTLVTMDGAEHSVEAITAAATRTDDDHTTHLTVQFRPTNCPKLDQLEVIAERPQHDTWHRATVRARETGSMKWTALESVAQVAVPTPAEALATDLAGLFDAGCSAAEALDFFMTTKGGFSQREWAAHRGVTRRAVNNNVRDADAELADHDD